MKNIMTKLSMLLCAALGVASCENADIDEQMSDMAGEVLTGEYRIVSTLGIDTKVSVDDDGVLSWEDYDKLYIFESVDADAAVPSEYLTFTIDPESISTDGKSAEFVGEGLVSGKSYYAIASSYAPWYDEW